MKRYGDNLPSNCQQGEVEGNHGRTTRVMLTGCAVRYDMLAYLQPANDPPRRKHLNIFSFIKFGLKKDQEGSK